MPGKIAHPRSKISGNEGGFKEFRIDELFEVYSPKKRFNANEIKLGEGFRYIARGSENNGIKGYTRQDPKYLSKANTISFGQDTATIYYQSQPYFTGDKIKVMEPKGFSLEQSSASYLIASMRKTFSLFSWGSSSFNEKILKSVSVSLPTTKNGNIDFSYMEKYIEELQQQQHNKIETFFKNIGLDNCELTRKETESLRRFKNQQIEFKQFEIVEKFNVKNSQNNLKSDVVFESGNTPYVTASEGNNSVVSRISCADNLKESGNSIMIGGKTLVVTYQPEDFVSNDSHNLILYLKDSEKRTENIQLFSVCALNHFLKPIYSWGDSISKTKIQKDILSLPVTAHGSIDYDFMETFISAQKKLVAQKVVRWLEQQKIADNILEIERSLPKNVLPMVAEKGHCH